MSDISSMSLGLPEDIDAYRVERAKLETRWEEEKADAAANISASEGSGSILGEGTRELQEERSHLEMPTQSTSTRKLNL